MSTIQIGAFVILSAIVHVVLFKVFARWLFTIGSVLLGAFLSVVAYQLWVRFEQGFMDPFFQVAAAVQFGLALLIGLIVALMFRAKKPQAL